MIRPQGPSQQPQKPQKAARQAPVQKGLTFLNEPDRLQQIGSVLTPAATMRFLRQRLAVCLLLLL